MEVAAKEEIDFDKHVLDGEMLASGAQIKLRCCCSHGQQFAWNAGVEINYSKLGRHQGSTVSDWKKKCGPAAAVAMQLEDLDIASQDW